MTAPVDLGLAIAELTPGLVALRRALHQHPELAFDEVWTAATLAARMRALGLSVTERIGSTGVLARLDGARPGQTLLIRADMDALPMEDTTGREYASRIANRNHACGHDVHSAIVAGVAEVLTRHRRDLTGRVAFVFQPADEPMRGAARMIEEGLLERVDPDMSLSVHVLPMATSGQAVVQRGPLWASWDTQVLRISGPASPAARFDVARVTAEVATALYRLVEKEGHSADDVTFRVRSLSAEQPGRGDASQAAIEVHLGRGESGHAAIEINLALYDNALRARLLARFSDVATAMVASAGGTRKSGTAPASTSTRRPSRSACTSWRWPRSRFCGKGHWLDRANRADAAPPEVTRVSQRQESRAGRVHHSGGATWRPIERRSFWRVGKAHGSGR